ncbi:MAG: cupin domain-containing protein [Pseudomonadota bacterium]|nr:cupin domain-containing protein [Pseudomonadota bacterium]
MAANDRIVVTKSGNEHSGTGQSGGLALVTGVGPQHTPATKLWFGKASNKPGFRSLPHHHGEAETGAYVLSGRARIYFGKDYQEFVDLSEGDFMFVPPFLAHLEANMSTTDELWWIACRSPENLIVNLPDVDDAALTGYRRG